MEKWRMIQADVRANTNTYWKRRMGKRAETCLFASQGKAHERVYKEDQELKADHHRGDVPIQYSGSSREQFGPFSTLNNYRGLQGL
jgi:hypothetical protein